jgi:hypothetical protein
MSTPWWLCCCSRTTDRDGGTLGFNADAWAEFTASLR